MEFMEQNVLKRNDFNCNEIIEFNFCYAIFNERSGFHFSFSLFLCICVYFRRLQLANHSKNAITSP